MNYYDKLDELDNSLRAKYVKRFGNRYSAGCLNAKKMHSYFKKRCREEGIRIGMHSYAKELGSAQLSILGDNE